MTWYGTVDGTAAKAEAIAQRAPDWRALGEWWRALSQDDPVTYRYVLLLRFMLANAIAIALVGAAMGQGWVSAILASDYGIYSKGKAVGSNCCHHRREGLFEFHLIDVFAVP